MTITQQLRAIEDAGGDGTLRFGRGRELRVSSLDKLFFPKDGFTKGDVMRYYADVSPLMLPLVKDRALSLKRFPDGVDGKSFFQQKAPRDAPAAVRVETLASEDGDAQERLVAGDLATLLYTVQLGAIEVNPWHARAQSLHVADYFIIDLDPGPRAKLARLVSVALQVKEVLDRYRLHAGVKTSGATGVHIGVPLPRGTTAERALVVSQRIAETVAREHPRDATVQRSIAGRPTSAVYVDYGQNSRGKTVAAAYSMRAKKGAPVSTPLDWSELTADLDPGAFTIATAPARFAKVGDLWGAALRKRNSLARLDSVD